MIYGPTHKHKSCMSIGEENEGPELPTSVQREETKPEAASAGLPEKQK